MVILLARQSYFLNSKVFMYLYIYVLVGTLGSDFGAQCLSVILDVERERETGVALL